MTNKPYGISSGVKTGLAGLAVLACFGVAEAQATCTYDSYLQQYICSGPSSSSYAGSVSTSTTKQGDIGTATAATASRNQGAQTTSAISGRINSAVTRAFAPAGGQTRVSALGNQSFTSGLAGGDGTIDYSVWGDGTASRLVASSDSPSGTSNGRNYSLVVGGDVKFGQFLVGLAGSGQASHMTLAELDGRSLVTSYGITPYAAYSINPIFSVSAQFTYAWVNNAQHLFESDTIGTTRTNGNWDSDRYGGSFAVNAYYPIGKINLTGTTGVNYTHEGPDSYVNSRGQRISPQGSNVGVYQLGGEVGYAFEDFEPYAGITMEYEFDATGVRSFKTGNIIDTSGTVDAIYKVGGRLHYTDSVLGGLEFSTVQHRDYDQSYALSANVRVSF